MHSFARCGKAQAERGWRTLIFESWFLRKQ